MRVAPVLVWGFHFHAGLRRKPIRFFHAAEWNRRIFNLRVQSLQADVLQRVSDFRDDPLDHARFCGSIHAVPESSSGYSRPRSASAAIERVPRTCWKETLLTRSAVDHFVLQRGELKTLR